MNPAEILLLVLTLAGTGMAWGWLLSPLATDLVTGPDHPVTWHDVRRLILRKAARPHIPTIVIAMLCAGVLPLTLLSNHPIYWPLWPGYIVAAGGCAVLVSTDFKHHRLPDIITVPTTLIVGGLFLLPAAIAGQWSAIIMAIIAIIVSFLFYFILAMLGPTGALGFGDVKLSPLLALVTAPYGWTAPAIAIFLAFLFGSLYGLIMRLFRRITKTTPIPFGPWMIAGAAVSIIGHVLSGF